MKTKVYLCAIAIIAGSFASFGQFVPLAGLGFAQQSGNPLNPGLIWADPGANYGPGLGYPGRPGVSVFDQNIVPKSDEVMTADLTKDGKFHIAWEGRTEFVSGAFVALLDKSKKEIKRHVFDAMPISLTADIPKEAKYFRLVMTYVNGTATSITSPIPVPEKATEPKKEATSKPKDTTGLGGP